MDSVARMENLDTHHEVAKNFESAHLGRMLVRRESDEVRVIAAIHAIEHVAGEDGAIVRITALVSGTTEDGGTTEVQFRYAASEQVELVKLAQR